MVQPPLEYNIPRGPRGPRLPREPRVPDAGEPETLDTTESRPGVWWLVGWIFSVYGALLVASTLQILLWRNLGLVDELSRAIDSGGFLRVTRVLVLLDVTEGLATGVALGTIQWLILRRRLSRARWWVPITTIAMVVSGGSAVILVLPVMLVQVVVGVEPELSAAFFVPITLAEALVAGVAVGGAQSALLRGAVSTAGWWIAGVIAATAVSEFIVTLAMVQSDDFSTIGILRLFVATPLFVLITGVTMFLLLRHRRITPALAA